MKKRLLKFLCKSHIIPSTKNLITILMLSGFMNLLAQSPVTLIPTTLHSDIARCGDIVSNNFAIKCSGYHYFNIIESYFYDNFNFGQDLWTTETYNGSDNLWHKSSSTSINGISWWCGIETNSNYSNTKRISNALISPTFNLKEINKPILEFYEYLETESNKDICYVDITTDNGATWSTLKEESGSYNTKLISIDLSAYKNNTVKFRFYFETSDGNNNSFQGWIIDNVQLKSKNSSISVYNGVSVNDSSNVNVYLDAYQVPAGNYASKIYIINDDTIVSSLSYTYKITGNPDIYYEANHLLTNTFINIKKEDSLTIKNLGCDTLFITNITSTLSSFSTPKTQLFVLPYSSVKIFYSFKSSSLGSLNATIDIANDAQNATINVSTEVKQPPIFSTDTKMIDATVSCEGSFSKTIKISNTGAGSLDFSTRLGSGKSLEKVLQSLDNGISSVTSVIPGKFNFDEGIERNYIEDGGNDMYDGGNRLSTNYYSNFNYSDGVITNEGNVMGLKGAYFTKKYEGLFVMAADLDNVSNFNIYGDLGSDGYGKFNADKINMNINGREYIGFVTKVYDAGDPSINHLIILEKNDSVSQTFDSTTKYENHSILKLNGNKRLYYLLYAGMGGQYIDNDATKKIMSNFIKLVQESGWIKVTPESGSIATNSFANLNVQLVGDNMADGIYNDQLMIVSNDPFNSEDTVNCTFNIQGNPSVSVSKQVLNFGSLITTLSKNDSIWIKNSGCDTLKVSSIKNTLSTFEISDDSLIIAPYDSIAIAITFNPLTKETFNDVLSITSNDKNINIPITGIGLGSPVLTFDTDSIKLITHCENIVQQNFTISNSGETDLKYNISEGYSAINHRIDSANYEKTGDTTIHRFKLYNADLITLKVTLNGDYTSFSEFSELVINGVNYGIINDINFSDGSDFTRTYTFNSDSITQWLKDTLVVKIVNSSEVNPGYGLQLHVVEINSYTNWIHLSSTSGTLTPGASQIITAEFHNANLAEGSYSGFIEIGSNDINKTKDSILCKLDVGNSVPKINVESNIIFPSALVNSAKTYSLSISNSGCRTLKVSDITIEKSEFTVDSKSFDILPGQSKVVYVTFNSASLGSFKSMLTIYSDDTNKVVNMTAECVEVLSVSHKSFMTKLYPNPFGTSLNVELDHIQANSSYMIYSISGKLILIGDINDIKTTINTKSLETGSYILRIQNDKEIDDYKIIKK